MKTVTINQHLLSQNTGLQNGLKQIHPKLTNHEMILVALEAYKGQELPLVKIKQLVLARFPNFNLGSLQPNDHSQLGNKNCCKCVGTRRQIFVNTGRATYYIL